MTEPTAVADTRKSTNVGDLGKIAPSVRGKAALRMAAISILSRPITVIANLLTVPLVLHHLGQERYGVWMAAIAFSTFFTMADGGVSKGAITEVAVAYGHDDREKLRAILASALMCTLIFVVLFVFIAFIVSFGLDWQWVFHIHEPSIALEAQHTVLALSLIYSIGFIPGTIREVRVGMQQGAQASLWDLIGILLGFLGVFVGVRLNLGLTAIAILWSGGPLAIRTVNAAQFLSGPAKEILPRWQDIDKSTCRRLVVAGGAFMLQAVALVLAVQSDQLFITRFLGPDAVTRYSIFQRLFNQPQVIITMALIAQWPAYAEALGRGDIGWIRKNFFVSAASYFALSALIALALTFLAIPIAHIWVGQGITLSKNTVTAIGMASVLNTVSSIFIFFYMSVGLHRRMMLSQIALVVIALPLYFLLVPRLGIIGASVSVGLSQLLAVVIPGILTIRGIFTSLNSWSNFPDKDLASACKV